MLGTRVGKRRRGHEVSFRSYKQQPLRRAEGIRCRRSEIDSEAFVASSVGGEMTRVQVEEAKDLCRNQAEIGEEESDSTGRED